MKNPPRHLDHLGLKIRPIETQAQLNDAMALQRAIAVKARKHIYFAHTPIQLRNDRQEYERVISNQEGRLLGVYREAKILGLMLVFINSNSSNSKKTGGFSFFLHPSIQGLGITKTGYLLLLEFLLKMRVYKFYGGTSQAAIQFLAKVMERRIHHLLYVKMG
jgi:hypothetical protein